MKIKLYSTNCPKCKVLETLLKRDNMEYAVTTDISTLINEGMSSAPVLELKLTFDEARKYLGYLHNEKNKEM